MRKIFLLTILLIMRTIVSAQNHEERIDARPLNSININLIGDASLISINYERQYFISPTFILTGKLGFGYNEEFQLCFFGECGPAEKYLTIPHHITANLGKGRHFFEFGLGGTIICGNTSQPYFLYPMVGYRLLPLESNRINFRIFGQIPFSGFDTDDIIFFPFGLNLGISL